MSKTSAAKRAQRALGHEITSLWSDGNIFSAELPNIIEKLCLDVNSVFSMRVFYYLVTKDYTGLVDVANVSPHDYSCATSYLKDNQLVTLIKKYPLWDTTHNPLETAVKTFIKCEDHCRVANTSSLGASHDVALGSIINRAKAIIAEILQDVPAVTELPFEFGPGATFSVKGNTSSLDKLRGTLDVTPESVEAAISFLQSCPGWLTYHDVLPTDVERIRAILHVIPGDRLSFVPKTAKTHRPIAIGPTVNVLMQKGYGAVIRNRLKQAGLHLNRAPERHKELARRASIDGSLATIDLSAASDTISWRVVADLLPIEWLDALHTVRSGKYRVGDKWYEYHKFSAMGNGYTFELESLLFFALAKATAQIENLSDHSVSVFGDDIILPSAAAHRLNDVLAHCSFEVNVEKSFYEGPFRESCGGDFYQGTDVRGFYCKGPVTMQWLVAFRNNLTRSGYMYYFSKTYRYISKLLKKYIEFLSGPDDGSDDHIYVPSVSVASPFNFVKVTTKNRRLPREFLLVKTWLLYEQDLNRYFNYPLAHSNTSYVFYKALKRDLAKQKRSHPIFSNIPEAKIADKIKIGIGSRTGRSQDGNLPSYNSSRIRLD